MIGHSMFDVLLSATSREWSREQWAAYDRLKWDDTTRLDGMCHHQLLLTTEQRTELTDSLRRRT